MAAASATSCAAGRSTHPLFLLGRQQHRARTKVAPRMKAVMNVREKVSPTAPDTDNSDPSLDDEAPI